MLWWRSKQFEDSEFPANKTSLGRIEGIPLDEIEWKRPGEFVVGKQGTRPFTLFNNGVPDSGDVNQFQIGDCWLLSALSTLAMTPHWIYNAFDAPRAGDRPCLNDKGKYNIRLFDARAGKHVSISIDDRIPCIQDESGKWTPIGVCLKKGAIWPALLEKAVAKFFGSYAAIEGGFSDWVLTAFTGHVAACFTFNQADDHMWTESCTRHKVVKGQPSKCRVLKSIEKTKAVSTGRMFMDLRERLQRKDFYYVIGAGSAGAGDDTDDINGLYLSHAYGVLGIYPLPLGFTLVKLRNPWGTGEWKGSWSDGNELWKKYPEVAQEVGYKAGDDGEFFMCTEDFAQIFDQVYYVKLPAPDQESDSEDEDEEDEEEEEEEEEDEIDPELQGWYGEDDDEDKEDEDEELDLLDAIKSVFDEFDMDGSGSLDATELASGLKYVAGFDKKQIKEACKAVDKDGDGKITLDEFQKWFIDHKPLMEANPNKTRSHPFKK